MHAFFRDARPPSGLGTRGQALILMAALVASTAPARAGTLVSMNFTNFGTVQIDLFDDLVSTTVNNFVQNYVSQGKYTNTMIHRVDTGLGVIQGGGYAAADGAAIATSAPIPLQYSRAHTRGTI